jgi:hypothetical protein
MLANADSDLFLSQSLAPQRWQAFSRISCPSLVLRGTCSSVLSRTAAERLVHALGQRASLVEIQAAGHAVLMDNPEKLAQEIEHFLGAVERNVSNAPSPPQDWTGHEKWSDDGRERIAGDNAKSARADARSALPASRTER